MQRLRSNQATLMLAAAGVGIAGAAIWAVRRGCCGGSRQSTAAPGTAATTAVPKKKLDAIVISGPSGVGKGTLITRLREEHPSAFGFSVSHTTRNPRAGEVDGKDYHFVTREVMEAMINNGEFLESCDVHGNMYGTSKAALAAVRAEGKVAIIEMDVQGAQKLKQRQGNLIFHYLFVTAPSLAELEKRIKKRGADDDIKTKVRLETARKEYQFLEENSDFFGTVLENDNLDVAYGMLVALLQSLGAEL